MFSSCKRNTIENNVINYSLCVFLFHETYTQIWINIVKKVIFFSKIDSVSWVKKFEQLNEINNMLKKWVSLCSFCEIVSMFYFLRLQFHLANNHY